MHFFPDEKVRKCGNLDENVLFFAKKYTKLEFFRLQFSKKKNKKRENLGLTCKQKTGGIKSFYLHFFFKNFSM